MSKLIVYYGATASFANPLSTQFDGVNEYVTHAGSLVSASAGTIDLWVKVLSFGSGAARMIFSDSGGYIQLQQILSATGQYRFGIFSGGARYSGTVTLILNTWYHLVCVWSSGVVPKLYVNKTLYAGPVVAGAIGDVTLPFSTGGLAAIATTHSNIVLNLWNVWNKAFTQAEVDELYDTNAGKPMNPNLHSAAANLTHYYRSGNGDTYPTITDNKGSSNGTMTNMEAGDFVSDAP